MNSDNVLKFAKLNIENNKDRFLDQYGFILNCSNYIAYPYILQSKFNKVIGNIFYSFFESLEEAEESINKHIVLYEGSSVPTLLYDFKCHWKLFQEELKAKEEKKLLENTLEPSTNIKKEKFKL